LQCSNVNERESARGLGRAKTRVKTGGYLGQCPCLPAGQLDPNERTKDDAGAIQNLAVRHGGMATHLGMGSEGGLTAGLGLRLLPQAFEPMPGNPCVMGRVLGISMPEVVLHGAKIRATIGEVMAAGVPEHVGPDPAELRLLARSSTGLAGETA
jgi:hypothetical protein